MADVTLSYKGSDILELSDSGSATLKTGGTYCEADIGLEYVKPSGGGEWVYIDTFTASAVNSVWITIPEEYQDSKEFALIGSLLPSSTDWGKVGINGTFSNYGSSANVNHLPVYVKKVVFPDETALIIASGALQTTRRTVSNVTSIGVGMFTSSKTLSGEASLYALR